MPGDTKQDHDYRSHFYGAYRSHFKGWQSSTVVDLRRMDELYGRFLSPGMHDVMEFGAGAGELIAWLSARGVANARGWDSSPEQISEAERQGRCVGQGDLFVVLRCQPSASLDGIAVIDVLEHLRRDELVQFAKEAARVLRPGGRLLVQTPNGDGIGVMPVWAGDLTHETLLTVGTMSQLFSPLGMSLTAAWGATPGSLTVARMTRQLAWRLLVNALAFVDVIQGGRRRSLYERVICVLFVKSSDRTLTQAGT